MISDEEDLEEVEPMEVAGSDESATKIHEGMNSIVTSLQALSESADQLEQRVKRPRRTTELEVSSPDFGKADAS